MSTLRIIHDDAVDRATIVASSTASPTTSVANLKTDYKSEHHRSVGTSVTYTLTWPTMETIAGVGFPATNLSSTSQIRVRLYDEFDTLVADSGLVDGAPGHKLELWDWTQPLNGNAFAYGGAVKSAVWLDDFYAARKLVIDLIDPDNPAGYIDCARLVAGGYWSTTYNPDYGAEVGINDMTENSRSAAGDLVSDRGSMYDTQSLHLSMMPEQDRARMMQIMRSNGTSRNLFVSVLTHDESPLAEQDWIIYAKRAASTVTYTAFRSHAFPLILEGW